LISGGSRGGGFVGPLRPGVVLGNARTAWLHQSSSVRDTFTEIVPQLYTSLSMRGKKKKITQLNKKGRPKAAI